MGGLWVVVGGWWVGGGWVVGGWWVGGGCCSTFTFVKKRRKSQIFGKKYESPPLTHLVQLTENSRSIACTEWLFSKLTGPLLRSRGHRHSLRCRESEETAPPAVLSGSDAATEHSRFGTRLLKGHCQEEISRFLRPPSSDFFRDYQNRRASVPPLSSGESSPSSKWTPFPMSASFGGSHHRGVEWLSVCWWASKGGLLPVSLKDASGVHKSSRREGEGRVSPLSPLRPFNPSPCPPV